jgi:isocitrate/isopropylmalate dehydrogenase
MYFGFVHLRHLPIVVLLHKSGSRRCYRTERTRSSVVRENTGGIYTDMGGVMQKGAPLDVATQVMQCSRPVVERCVKTDQQLNLCTICESRGSRQLG